MKKINIKTVKQYTFSECTNQDIQSNIMFKTFVLPYSPKPLEVYGYCKFSRLIQEDCIYADFLVELLVELNFTCVYFKGDIYISDIAFELFRTGTFGNIRVSEYQHLFDKPLYFLQTYRGLELHNKTKITLLFNTDYKKDSFSLKDFTSMDQINKSQLFSIKAINHLIKVGAIKLYFINWKLYVHNNDLENVINTACNMDEIDLPF